jgi:hypothetical protein
MSLLSSNILFSTFSQMLLITFSSCSYKFHNDIKLQVKLQFCLLLTFRILNRGSRDSTVGIATGYRLDDRGRGWSSSPSRVKNFLFSTSSRPALGPTQLPIQWVPEALSPGVKRPGREADHSPNTSAKVKKMWIYTSTLPYALMVKCLIS